MDGWISGCNRGVLNGWLNGCTGVWVIRWIDGNQRLLGG